VVEDQQTPELPPWNWSALSAVERRVEIEDLANWIAELQETHGRWVRLPNCWPCHLALRDELAAFWYWRQRIDNVVTAGPDELVHWHQSLRLSAQAWAEAFGGCRHQSLGEVDQARDPREAKFAASEPYLQKAIAGDGDSDS